MAKKGQPRKPRPKGAAPAATITSGEKSPVITIRAWRSNKERIEAKVPRQPRLVRLSQEWAYILRTRARWVDNQIQRLRFRERAISDLKSIGVSQYDIERLATFERVEVELHKWDSKDADLNRIHEAAAEIPWEYILSAATRGKGRFQPLLITRLFRHQTATPPPPPPKKVLFVESAPGRLYEEYDFESERNRIGAAVRGDPDTDNMTILNTPQLSELKQHVRKNAWDVIHVSGVDTHQLPQCIRGFYQDFEKKEAAGWKKICDGSGKVRDGMVLRQDGIAELPVGYDDLADALIDPAKPPSVVTLNLYHSGARTAREMVRRGAYAAIGFLDEVDDEVAELFYQAFYWIWCWPSSASTIPQAFMEAWNKMSGHPVHGTSIVIWTGQSVLEKKNQDDRTGSQPAPLRESWDAWLARLNTASINRLLEVELEIDREVNYSLLHNDRQLISKLTLTKLVDEPLYDIAVQVELNFGDDNYPFRCTQRVFNETQLILAPQVKIPLTASLPRSLRERVQSTVYVKVTCSGRTAYETTRRVTLIPVDEWLDDTDSNPWLPSFVLPRDPAILGIINSSRRYLIGISDNPAAGFDGYQSVDQSAPDPSTAVDAQVRAIWTALVNEYRIQYINPPPAYSDRTQRLRTPSDVIGSNTGTCIDLALLLASCLEYIDIYPVVVLLTGHAFIGYWRSEEAYERFASVQRVPTQTPAVGSRAARSVNLPYVDRYGWRLTARSYDEIASYVTTGDLIMIEATFLTSASSFAEAIEEGRANLSSRDEFDCLLDIRLARTAAPPVTPLPIING